MTPGWGISAHDLPRCCATDSFDEFYQRIASASSMLDRNTQHLFDKTPRYLSHLRTCLNKSEVPFIVTFRDPRGIVYSDYVRSGSGSFDEWFESYAPLKHAYLADMYEEFRNAPASPRILKLSLESLCMEMRRSCERMFSHCGESFDLRYLMLERLRFPNTKSDSIVPGYCVRLHEVLDHSSASTSARAVSSIFGVVLRLAACIWRLQTLANRCVQRVWWRISGK